ncbi:hypothetical protein NM208_g7767 [Fusarium decemcellulare]|uniref:Uncharacterized protein n=1 Tax=Fusarium decemcellulare TaxID=57161 RepID=A0ACC1S847_9HYPO|nr:hypothetical protein NM208_g7767 [Fusarium decemcellulare]
MNNITQPVDGGGFRNTPPPYQEISSNGILNPDIKRAFSISGPLMTAPKEISLHLTLKSTAINKPPTEWEVGQDETQRIHALKLWTQENRIMVTQAPHWLLSYKCFNIGRLSNLERIGRTRVPIRPNLLEWLCSLGTCTGKQENRVPAAWKRPPAPLRQGEFDYKADFQDDFRHEWTPDWTLDWTWAMKTRAFADPKATQHSNWCVDLVIYFADLQYSWMSGGIDWNKSGIITEKEELYQQEERFPAQKWNWAHDEIISNGQLSPDPFSRIHFLR